MAGKTFERARAERRLVLLDLTATWCHWCHVMDEKTYQDPRVVSLVNEKFVAIRVDVEAQPDLGAKYRSLGLPATVLFDSNGYEIGRRAGFLPSRLMLTFLQSAVGSAPIVQPELPQANRSKSESPYFSRELLKELQERYLASYDRNRGGWGKLSKQLQWDSAELALYRAAHGNQSEKKMALETLELEHRLIDPEWGGVYRLSTGGVWRRPQFEKILQVESKDLRIFALAYALWGDAPYLRAAKDIQRYLINFLASAEGAFYTSQDGDVSPGIRSDEYFRLNDKQRRKRGVPYIDRHTYARENGWAIQALATLYGVTGEPEYLTQAIRCADWVVKNRSLPGGGFRHGDEDQGGPFLGDSLSMGRAFLELYIVTADRDYLSKASETAGYIDATFGDRSSRAIAESLISFGYPCTKTSFLPFESLPIDRDENSALVRFANLLYRFTADPKHRRMAEAGMRFLGASGAVERNPTAGALLASLEFGGAPVHITVVGDKKDERAQSLFRKAIAYPSGYARIEWWDRKEGKLPNPDVNYPELERPAAFACTENRCSLPIFDAHELRAKVDVLYKRTSG